MPDTKVIISKFRENSGLLEITSANDLRNIDKVQLQTDVNTVTRKNLAVRKYLIDRDNAEAEFDLSRIPASIKEVRIVEIEGFDRTPCKDPHVENTNEIGFFTLLSVKRVGKDRYRFVFSITD